MVAAEERTSTGPLDRLLVTLRAGSPLTVGLLVAAAGWILDQASKALAVRTLAAGRIIEVPGPLFLQLTFNEGAAFGIGAPWWLFLVVTVIVAVLVVRNLPKSVTAIEPWAYGLLLAGALGNVTDRLLRPDPDGFARGEVVDFFATTFFPTFNVADVCITVGFGLLVIGAWQHEQVAGQDET